MLVFKLIKILNIEWTGENKLSGKEIKDNCDYV